MKQPRKPETFSLANSTIDETDRPKPKPRNWLKQNMEEIKKLPAIKGFEKRKKA